MLIRLLLAAALCAASFAQDIEPKLDEYMTALHKAGRFSGSVLVAKNGSMLLKKGYGLANVEWYAANTPQTKFRLGSVTKQFTAMAIMQLAEQGKLKVEDPVCKYVTDCPAAWSAITIHHLLTHTSGIPNFTSFPDYRARMRETSPASKMVGRFRDRPLDFAPGEQFSYSNSGYVLLGYILEKVTDQSYSTFLEQNIFGPLGMKNTGYDDDIAVLMNRASGYSRATGRLTNAAYLDMTIPHAAGALYSTVEDLSIWDQALAAGKLVSPQTMAKIFTPFRKDYAYGWIVNKRFNRKVIGHGGGINGFSTAIERFPDDKVTIIVLANVDSAQSSNVARALSAIVFGEKYEIPAEAKK